MVNSVASANFKITRIDRMGADYVGINPSGLTSLFAVFIPYAQLAEFKNLVDTGVSTGLATQTTLFRISLASSNNVKSVAIDYVGGVGGLLTFTSSFLPELQSLVNQYISAYSGLTSFDFDGDTLIAATTAQVIAAQAAAIAASEPVGLSAGTKATIVPALTTQTAEGAYSQVLTIQPITAGNEPFTVLHESFPNTKGAGTGYNHAVHMGWNATRHNGGTSTAGKAAILMGFEDNYFAGDVGEAQKYGTEWYVEYWSPNGTSQTMLRPFYARTEGSDTNTASNMTITHDIGSDGLGSFLVKSQGMGTLNPLLQVLPGTITLFRDTTVLSGNFALRPATGQAIFQIDSPVPPTFIFKISGTQAWAFQAQNSTTFIFYDNASRAQMTLTKGTTSDLAVTTFASQVVAQGAITAPGVKGSSGASLNLYLLAGASAGQVIFSDSALSNNNFTVSDNGNLGIRDGAALNAYGTLGFKIGGASTQKFGFYGAAPVARPLSTPAAAVDAATTQALVNDLRTKLLTLGLIG